MRRARSNTAGGRPVPMDPKCRLICTRPPPVTVLNGLDMCVTAYTLRVATDCGTDVMKYAIVLPDGAADEPVARLDDRTPLEAAKTPWIDWISINGRQGRVRTVPEGFSPGTDVATLSLFGYDPRKCYDGRAPIEAAARRIAVASDQLVFRCNFVTVVDGCMEDYTAGHIAQPEADKLINDLNEQVAEARCRFHSGVSYRNLLIAPTGAEMSPRCTPPHDIPGQPIEEHLPTGPGAEWVADVMNRAADVLRDHSVNQVRRDLGENPATDIWLWGQGRPTELEPFTRRFGPRGAAIAAVDLVRGLALGVGMELIDVAGATGFLDTDYAAKGAAAAAALSDYDLVVVHVEAPDEAGHLGDVDAKVRAIERIDEHVVGPLLDALRAHDDWRILIAPDHPTPVERRVHTADPPPFCVAGRGVSTVLKRPFCESNAAASDLQVDPGHDLMEYFLGGHATGAVVNPSRHSS